MSPSLYYLCFLLLVSIAACHPRSETATAPGHEPAEYTLTGEQDTTLVLIHDWNTNQDYWSDQVAAFSDDYTILTMNLVTEERQQDTLREWTVDHFAQDIVRIIEQEELTHLILVGHSMGGEVALAVREMIPDRTLALIGVNCFKDTGFILTENVQHNIDSFMVHFEADYAGNVEQIVTTGLFEPDTEYRDAYERVLHDYQTADPAVALSVYEHLFPAYETTKERLGRLPFPLRIIMSDYAPFNEEALREYARRGYRIKTIRHSGHFPMIEQPEVFNQALRSFLDAI